MNGFHASLVRNGADIMAEFENQTFSDVQHQFHDDSIYGFKLVGPDPDNHDWTSELQLDIDHILAWITADDGKFRFRISQALLVFENVTDLQVSFSFSNSSIFPLPIDSIVRSREPVVARVPAHREFHWKISLNDLRGGKIEFRSTGYRIHLRGEEMVLSEQTIPKHLRSECDVHISIVK